MTKKKEKVAKKKEELTLESFRKFKWEPKWIIKAGIIDTPAIVRLTEPPKKDPIMNMLCYMMTGKDLDDL